MRDDRNPLFGKKGKEKKDETELLDEASQKFIKLAAEKEKSERDLISAFSEQLQQGADVNAKDRFGNTALHYAVRDGRLNVVVFLLRSGANPDVQNASGTSVNDEIRSLSEESENPKENKMFALFALYNYMQELQEKVDKQQTKTTGSKKLDKLIKMFFDTQVGYNVSDTLNTLKNLWDVITGKGKSWSLTAPEKKLDVFTSPIVAALFESFRGEIEDKRQREGRRKGAQFKPEQLNEAFSKQDPSPNASPTTGRKKK